MADQPTPPPRCAAVIARNPINDLVKLRAKASDQLAGLRLGTGRLADADDRGEYLLQVARVEGDHVGPAPQIAERVLKCDRSAARRPGTEFG